MAFAMFVDEAREVSLLITQAYLAAGKKPPEDDVYDTVVDSLEESLPKPKSLADRQREALAILATMGGEVGG